MIEAAAGAGVGVVVDVEPPPQAASVSETRIENKTERLLAGRKAQCVAFGRIQDLASNVNGRVEVDRLHRVLCDDAAKALQGSTEHKVIGQACSSHGLWWNVPAVGFLAQLVWRASPFPSRGQYTSNGSHAHNAK